MENRNNKSLKTKLTTSVKNLGTKLKDGAEVLVEKVKDGAKVLGEKVQDGTQKLKTGATKTIATGLFLGALTFGALGAQGCTQVNNPYMPEIPEDPTIEAPYEEEETEQTPNIGTEQETPSIDTPSVEPTPDEHEQEQEKEQKLPDINNGEPHDESTDNYKVTFREYHSDPYSRIYHNGFTIHNFFGEKPDMDQDSVTTAEYANYGIQYLFEQLENFEKSLEGRPAAQHYFDEFITRSKGKIIALAKEYQDKSIVDFSLLSDVMNAITTNVMYVMEDFVDAQPDDKSRKATNIYINGLMVGGFKFGGGKNFLTSPDMQNDYYRAKDEIYNTVDALFPDNQFKQEPLIDICSHAMFCAFDEMSEEGKLHTGVTAADMMAITNFMACAPTIYGGYKALHENGYDIGNEKIIINPGEKLYRYINDKYPQKDAEQDLQK